MSMKRPLHNLGPVDWIGAEAVGLPGQRTFKLMAYTAKASAQMWLEKEQLQALAEAIARMLLQIDADRGMDLRSASPSAAPSKPVDFPASPEIEFHVNTLGLRYDSQRDLIALEAYDRDDPEEDRPAFRCLATREQLEALQVNSLEVVSAGRPRCPLCGTPLSAPGMPHFCPSSNGHQKLAEDEVSGEQPGGD